MPSEELDQLRSQNAELRRRVEATRIEIDELRSEALQRRDEVRKLVEGLPTVVSRRSVLRKMVGQSVHHPDKTGVLGRALRKLGRAPRKAARVITRSQ